MILRLPRPSQQLRIVLQRAGYTPFRDPRTGEQSYVRRLGTYFYPRFHLYTEERDHEVVLKLHLDQKQPSYGSGHKHSGEYDGKLVEAEIERLRQTL